MKKRCNILRPKAVVSPEDRSFGDYLRSLYIWAVTGLLVLAWFPLLVLVWLFDRDPSHHRTGRWLRKCAVLSSRINPALRFLTEGKNIPEPGQAYIVVSNHQSLTDIPVLARLPIEMKWVAKKSLFMAPLLGPMMRMAGDIPVDFKHPRKRERVLQMANRYLHQGISVMFFPEGKRSTDGCLHRFSNGAFELAVETGVPVLPVVIDGLWDFLPSHSLWFGKPRDIRMKVLPPIDTHGMDEKDVHYLREKVRFRMLHQLAEWRGMEDPDRIDAIVLAREAVAAEQEKDSCPLFV